MSYQNINNPLDENLFSNENYTQMNNNKKEINPNDFIIEDKKKHSDKNENYNENEIFIVGFRCSHHIIRYSFIVIIILLSFIPKLIYPDNLYMFLPIFALGIITSLFICYYSYRKIEIIKDISNKKVIVKFINYLCLTKLKIKCNLENIHFRANKEIFHSTNGKARVSTELIIVNDYKNIEDIDLDNTNIKKKPAKYYYSIKDIKIENCYGQDVTTALNCFIGAPNSIDLCQYTDNQCTKISEIFYSFFLSEPVGCSVFKWILFGIAILVDIYFVFRHIEYSNDTYKKAYERLMFVYILPLFDIGIYIIYKFIRMFFFNIVRIDCIYSKNFDRLFIGLVKYTRTSYAKTFEYQLNSIDKFVFQKYGGDDRNYILKAVLKNNEIQQICKIKDKGQYTVQELICFLNERLDLSLSNIKTETL